LLLLPGDGRGKGIRLLDFRSEGGDQSCAAIGCDEQLRCYRLGNDRASGAYSRFRDNAKPGASLDVKLAAGESKLAARANAQAEVAAVTVSVAI
jgi:hypothetical protein